MKHKKKVIISIISIILIAVIITGVYLYYIEGQNNKGMTLINASTTTTTTSSQEKNIDWSKYETYDLTLNNKTETITKEGVYNVTGSISNGSININTEGNIKLILNTVSITNSNGPANLVENAKNTYIELKGTNKISATTNETEDGAIFSHDDLFFGGSGSLTITSNYDGIVSKDALTFYNGSYTIKAEDDGIRGKDSVAIKDGTYNITTTGKAIKSTNETEIDKGTITIEGGTFTINSKDDAIHINSEVVISDGKFTIKTEDDGIHADGKVTIKTGILNITAQEGIAATYVKIEGGTTSIIASDDGINATSKSNQYDVLVEITGGNVTIKMGQGDTDAIDSNGKLYITGGTIDITANSPFDYDGESKFTGGTVTVNGEKVSSLQNQMMGGAGRNNMQGRPDANNQNNRIKQSNM